MSSQPANVETLYCLQFQPMQRLLTVYSFSQCRVFFLMSSQPTNVETFLMSGNSANVEMSTTRANVEMSNVPANVDIKCLPSPSNPNPPSHPPNPCSTITPQSKTKMMEHQNHSHSTTYAQNSKNSPKTCTFSLSNIFFHLFLYFILFFFYSS